MTDAGGPVAAAVTDSVPGNRLIETMITLSRVTDAVKQISHPNHHHHPDRPGPGRRAMARCCGEARII